MNPNEKISTATGAKKFKSVSRRLITYIVIASSLITFILTIFQLYRDYKVDISGISDGFHQVEQVHLNSVSQILWAADHAKLKVLIEGLANLKDVVFVSVTGEEGFYISVGDDTVSNKITRSFAVEHSYRGDLIHVGTLRIDANLDAVYKRMLDKVVVILVSNAIKTALVAIFMLFIIHRLVITHLTRISEYMETTPIGGAAKLLTLDRDNTSGIAGDELDLVVNSINEVSKRVATVFDRMQASETELRVNEARYKEASHIAHLGHWTYDQQADKLLHCSDELANIHGVSTDTYVAMISSIEKDIERVHPDDRELYAEVIRDAQKHGTPFDVEYRIIRPDGIVRHLREIGEPIFDDAGTLIQERGTIQDITDRKELEDQLRHSQRMEAVGQLTGGVAHDFNNLLAVMLGNAELLEDLAGEDQDANNNIEAIKAAVARASSLTGRLLAFSRQSALVPVAADVDELIGGLYDMLQRALGETVELRIESTVGLWAAMTDKHQFENALVNLTLNARDAMPQGGLLTIETANVTLGETYAAQYEEVEPGDYVRVSVSDTGTGIPPDVLAKVFEPFFTTKEVGKGSGLGLSMVFGFVKQSSGHITIYSEVDHGTSVKLYIPRSQDGPSEGAINGDELEHTVGTERILVVEDDPDVRRIPTAILRDQGYEVIEAGNGEDATKRLQEGPPFDLLFTDIVLPGGLNGVEVAEQARKLQSSIKILYSTGYAENVNIQTSKIVASGLLVNKPYLRTELLEKVRNVLDGKSN
ncbi:ATP-binding protein [Parasedimentitalea maritima]|uniref:histidine kinase n=1 Tax=Parasedimentitalea maritima TaxID=2578117 RepID=A0A6A4R9H9_9RHOB|nr:ATP-binding protein [Zongyanglinia marina]KAE9628645.1 response regulator [Zongyanglinia marina]